MRIHNQMNMTNTKRAYRSVMPRSKQPWITHRTHIPISRLIWWAENSIATRFHEVSTSQHIFSRYYFKIANKEELLALYNLTFGCNDDMVTVRTKSALQFASHLPLSTVISRINEYGLCKSRRPS